MDGGLRRGHGHERHFNTICDGTLLGHAFESLVTLSVRVYAQAAEANVGHHRTAGTQQEVDLAVEREDQPVVAVEVKLSRSVDDRDMRRLHWPPDVWRGASPEARGGWWVRYGPAGSSVRDRVIDPCAGRA